MAVVVVDDVDETMVSVVLVEVDHLSLVRAVTWIFTANGRNADGIDTAGEVTAVLAKALFSETVQWRRAMLVI